MKKIINDPADVQAESRRGGGAAPPPPGGG